MSRTHQTVAPALQAYFRKTSAEAAIQAAMPSRMPDTAPPWTSRRLKQALAELGPAQPAFDNGVPLSVRSLDPASAVEAHPPEVPAPSLPLRSAQRFSGADFEHAPDAGYDLPPAVASLIAALPVQPLPLGPQEIVAALAGTGSDATTAHAMVHFMPEPVRRESIERPPMMIERALAEQELRTGAPLAIPVRYNPWPAVAAGFTCAMATGVALYFVLVLR